MYNQISYKLDQTFYFLNWDKDVNVIQPDVASTHKCYQPMEKHDRNFGVKYEKYYYFQNTNVKV